VWPGHRALRYYLTSANTGNEDLRERWGQKFAVYNIVSIMAMNRELQSMTIKVSDHDPHTRSENRNINTGYFLRLDFYCITLSTKS